MEKREEKTVNMHEGVKKKRDNNVKRKSTQPATHRLSKETTPKEAIHKKQINRKIIKNDTYDRPPAAAAAASLRARNLLSSPSTISITFCQHKSTNPQEY